MKKLILFIVTFLLPTFAQAIEVSFEEDASVPLVYVNVAVKTGAVSDPAGQSGLTNFLGEMLLRGTQSKTKEQINLAIDQMGARLEIETRSESMILRGAVLKSQLIPFLALMGEVLTQPVFSEKEIKSLKSEVVSNLLEELGNDGAVSSRGFSEFLFRDHPYGKPIMGKIKDVEHLSRAQVQAQYDRLIRDSLLLVVGTGDTSQSALKDWAKLIKVARPGDVPKDLAHYSAPENAPAKRVQIIDKPDRTQTQINVGQIGVRMTEADFFPLYVGNHAFGGSSFNATLMSEIRVKRGWSYGAYSYFRQGLKPRSWQAHLFPAEKDSVPALAETLKLIGDLQKNGITEEQFNLAQTSLVNNAGFDFNTPRKRVENKLIERTLDLPDGFMKEYGPKISGVKFADVNSALKKFLKPDQLAVSVLGTASHLKAKMADATGVTADKIVVTPYNRE